MIALRQRVAELTLQNQLLANKGAENARLREMLGFREASQYRLRACRVVSREPSSWWTSVQVNVGWQDEPDLTKDQPVVSPRGVVGKTGTVSRYVTDVILLVNVNCSISATVEGLRDQGIVEGQDNFEESKPRVGGEISSQGFASDGRAVSRHQRTRPLFSRRIAAGHRGRSSFGGKENIRHSGFTGRLLSNRPPDLNKLDELFIVLGPKAAKTGDTPADSSTGSGGGT